MMKIVIAGGGIGGLTTALALHELGIGAEVYEQSRELLELGVGINILPHAVKELASLGLMPALDAVGVRMRKLVYTNRLGQTVWQELRGIDANYVTPQFSIHRGKLHAVLLRVVLERLGAARVHTDCCLVDFQERTGQVIATFERRDAGERIEVEGDALIGADGIHSRVRALLYPHEGPPAWNGIMLWRGATEWPVYADGRTMVIAGGNAAKFVFYPIHADISKPETRLTNWAIMAPIGDCRAPPPRREDWNRPGRREEALPFVRDKFRLGFVDPGSLIEATRTFHEYPMCDRDPLPRWSFGRVTLLGDAAHPMYPVGGNGASQATLDARCVARLLAETGDVVEALAAYEAARLPVTAKIVHDNRRGGPERVIDVVEERAPDGFVNLDTVVSHAELESIVKGYARMAGFDQTQVNR
jgi:2-polyprenyl-6-methoxyphenol hydroxylase-like FAD-dependent oxidoreductase